jgi:hypothetical protein
LHEKPKQNKAYEWSGFKMLGPNFYTPITPIGMRTVHYRPSIPIPIQEAWICDNFNKNKPFIQNYK